MGFVDGLDRAAAKVVDAPATGRQRPQQPSVVGVQI
jgi:hypothetical protein